MMMGFQLTEKRLEGQHQNLCRKTEGFIGQSRPAVGAASTCRSDFSRDQPILGATTAAKQLPL
jgi:hypothetical protein